MATRTERAGTVASDAVKGTYGLEDPARALALAAGLVLTGSYVAVLVDVTTVVGGTPLLLAGVAGALALATVTARALRPRHAAVVGIGLLVAGFVGYLEGTPYGWLLIENLGLAISDAIALLTGVSILRMTDAGIWAVGFAPGPVFLSWYLFVRQRYATGAVVGSGALAVFVLTGDAGTVVTLAGAVAATAVVGLGEIERRTGTVEQFDTLAVLAAAMIVVGGSITVVPSGEGRPLLPDGQTRTVEGGLIAADDRVDVLGSISLSPKVRFAVESDEPANWRVGAYDRYTGQGWVRSGQPRSAREGLPAPPSPTQRVEQRVTALSDVGAMPAVWRPIRVGNAPYTQVTSLGGIKPDRTLSEGTSYDVVSRRPASSADRLRSAGTAYPDDVESTYTQLPSETPDRLDAFTGEIVAGATTPYDKTVRIERWLEENKAYSLDVERPDGSVADSFVFEMEAGYCTYFATAMVTMLRTEGIPARFVTGYTTGQRVAEDEWVVRGQDSHAWVEVYFPDAGWIAFDPTPGGPRSSAEEARLEQARRNGDEGVDARGSESGPWTPTEDPSPSDPVTTVTATDTPASPGDRPTLVGSPPQNVTPIPGDTGGSGPELPSRNVLGFGLVVLLGVVAAIRRTGVGAEAYQLARIQWQGSRSTPRADAERAFERLEGLLERRYRERRPGETRAAYLRALSDRDLDDRARRVGDRYHRARYGPGIDPAAADEVVELVDELVRERTPVRRWLR